MSEEAALQSWNHQLRETVAELSRGKSLADFGALWTRPNIAVPAGARAGARTITVIDATPLGDQPWKDFDKAMAAAHAQGYSRIWADLSVPGAAGRLGCFDVTHCDGLVSRCVSPLALLINLREITRETAIISSLVLPVRSDGGQGRLELDGGRMLSLFGLGPIDELLAAEFLEAHASGQWRLPGDSDTADSGIVAADGHSPWFWLLGRESLERQIRAAGFEIEYAFDNGPHVRFVCHPRGSGLRTNVAAAVAALPPVGGLSVPADASPKQAVSATQAGPATQVSPAEPAKPAEPAQSVAEAPLPPAVAAAPQVKAAPDKAPQDKSAQDNTPPPQFATGLRLGPGTAAGAPATPQAARLPHVEHTPLVEQAPQVAAPQASPPQVQRTPPAGQTSQAAAPPLAAGFATSFASGPGKSLPGKSLPGSPAPDPAKSAQAAPAIAPPQPGPATGAGRAAANVAANIAANIAGSVSGDVMAVALASASQDMSVWANGIAHEALFWRDFVRTGGLQWPEEFEERVQLERPVNWIFEDLIQEIGREKIRILDAGAGPFTSVGSTSQFADLEVVAVDPLAPVYDRILALRAITPPVRTQYAPVEALNLFTRKTPFDIVHVRNALDHSFSPLLGILQMIACTARGGVIYLSHHENEALRANYTDFHQFNFEVKGDRFFIWNREHRIDIGDWLRGIARVAPLEGGLGADVLIYPAPGANLPALNEKQDVELWFHVLALVEDAMKLIDINAS